MRICIYGAGAIGAWLGVQLSLAGEEVTLIARGPHLAAMQKNGVKLLIDGSEKVAHPRCVEDPREAGPQDYVIITLKAHSFPGVVDSLQPLFDDDTTVVTGVNGIPWWYFYRLKGAYEDHQLDSVDPGGRIWEAVGPQRALGCVVYPAAEIAEPGVIRHIEGDRFILGEPDGQPSERAERLCAALNAAGFKSRVRNNIRDDIWVKLWGNLCFNPISALTHATLDKVAGEPGDSVSVLTNALPAALPSVLTRPRCCRTWNWGGRWKSMRWSRWFRNWAASWTWQRRRSMSCWPLFNSAPRLPGPTEVNRHD